MIGRLLHVALIAVCACHCWKAFQIGQGKTLADPGWSVGSLTIGALVERIHLRGERLVVSCKMIPNYVHNWVNLKVTVT